MPPIFDYLILACLIFFFARGWQKGLLRTLLGPFSLIIGGIAGYIYYLKTGNILNSLIISIAGPFVLNIALGLILKLARKSQPDEGKAPNLGNFLGGTLSLLWSGTLLILTVYLVGLVPGNLPWFQSLQGMVTASHTYNFISTKFEKEVPAVANIKNINTVFQDPERLQKFQDTEEFQAVLNHDVIKNLYGNEETARQLQEKDFTKLLNNPDIQAAVKAIMADPKLLENFLRLQAKMTDSESSAETTTAPKPKVMEKKDNKWQIVY